MRGVKLNDRFGKMVPAIGSMPPRPRSSPIRATASGLLVAMNSAVCIVRGRSGSARNKNRPCPGPALAWTPSVGAALVVCPRAASADAWAMDWACWKSEMKFSAPVFQLA